MLDEIKSPMDLKLLAHSELQALAGELRERIVTVVSRSGGHLASSLGAVELCLALHYVFAAPADNLVFDVGHQAYAHKLLTGRQPAFNTLRAAGGLSGFLKRSESPYDVFGAGHAGTSLAAAAGLHIAGARAENHSIAVIGDASIANGLAFEALNHIGALALKNFIVVLNDNAMSIAPTVGALSRSFSLARLWPFSCSMRGGLRKSAAGKLLAQRIHKLAVSGQTLFSEVSSFYETLGFRYLGPVDGHSLEELIKVLEQARFQDKPILLHVLTQKGRGLAPAEKNPTGWHGIAGKAVQTGKTSSQPAAGGFSEVFGGALLELRRSDPRVVAVTAAMGDGTGLAQFKAQYPESFFDVGIAEECAVTFAAGLAAAGKRPVVAIYSTFLQRAYDQILHDVAIQNLPVIFAIDRAGLVGPDGETHHGIYDLGFLRAMPRMVLAAPADGCELKEMLKLALAFNGPFAIRYPRAAALPEQGRKRGRAPGIGRAEVCSSGQNILLLALGPLVKECELAAQKLRAAGISVTVVNMRFVKPLDLELLEQLVPKHKILCTVEEHAQAGGFGSAVLEALSAHHIAVPAQVACLGVPDIFVPQGKREEQLKSCGLQAVQLEAALKRLALRSVTRSTGYPDIGLVTM